MGPALSAHTCCACVSPPPQTYRASARAKIRMFRSSRSATGCGASSDKFSRTSTEFSTILPAPSHFNATFLSFMGVSPEPYARRP